MKAALSLLVLLIISACSKGGGGGSNTCIGCDLPPATTEQKQRMESFNQEITDTSGSTAKHITQDLKDIGRRVSQNTSRRIQLSENGKQYAKEVDEVIGMGACEVVAEGREDLDDLSDIISGNKDLKDPKFRIAYDINIQENKSLGAPCPIDNSLSFAIDLEAREINQGFQVDVKLDLNNRLVIHNWSSLYLGMKIHEITMGLKGGLNMTATQAATTGGLQMSGQSLIRSKDSLEGEVQVYYTMVGNLNFNNQTESGSLAMEIVMDHRFKDFRVVGAINVSQTQDSEELVTKYRINSEEVSEEEFFQYFSTGLAGEVMPEALRQISRRR